ncbi:MAG TPA: phosphopantetheine-binding protein [Vicinamibacteria bacterium]|nr:phosphopantetheine-binding protein [Vicinamibacteria bacterium]
MDAGKPLQSELDIDSFDFLNLRVAVRDELGVSVAESDNDKVMTLDDIVRFLAAML